MASVLSPLFARAEGRGPVSGQQHIEVLAYVIDALRRQEARHRMNRWPVPSGVADLISDIGFEVSRGQRGSTLANGHADQQIEVIRPVAVSYETAAAMLEVSVSTIKRLIQKGELTPLAFGGARRLRVADVEALVATGAGEVQR